MGIPFIALGLFGILAKFVQASKFPYALKYTSNVIAKSWTTTWFLICFATGTTSSRETDSAGRKFVRHTHFAMPGKRLLIKWSQYAEMRADCESALLASTAHGAIAYLKTKIELEDGEDYNDDESFESPYESHPPITKRIKELEKIIQP